MHLKLRIGIVGCGAIGRSLARAVREDFRKSATLCGLYDINSNHALNAAKQLHLSKRIVAPTLAVLISKSDLIIEAASKKGAREIAQKSIARGKDLMIMSAGGIVSCAKKLFALAAKQNSKVYIPSGAIAGIDGLKAAYLSGIKEVTITTRKNPLSFQNVPYVKRKKIDLAKITRDKVLFHGSAKMAVKYFPQNINVAAVLSLAGIGEHKTKVKIVASPYTNKNIHDITIVSSAATITTRTENVLHPQNPKTSYLAVLSAIATLKRILEPIQIGT